MRGNKFGFLPAPPRFPFYFYYCLWLGQITLILNKVQFFFFFVMVVSLKAKAQTDADPILFFKLA